MTSFDERLEINNEVKSNIIYDEHLVRYELAKQFVQDKVVLDVACGSGYGSYILAKAGAKKVIAVDVSQEAIDKAKARFSHENIEYILDSAESLEKIEEHSVDTIVSFETIEHLQNYKNYLKALTKVLKYDGMAIISTPNKEVYQEKNPFHIKEFTESEFKAELSQFFPSIAFLGQSNCMASYISEKGSSKPFLANNRVLINENNSDSLYFIAICAMKDEFLTNVKENSSNIISLNPIALRRWENNKGWKLVNGIYKVFQKIGIFK